jgi:hypothetical protein
VPDVTAVGSERWRSAASACSAGAAAARSKP